METRWDVSKRLTSVTHTEFRKGVDIVQRMMENFTGQPSALSVVFYSHLKYNARPDAGPRTEILTEQLNSDGVFKTVRYAKDILRSDWKKAHFVEAVLRPERPAMRDDNAYYYATIEAKGLRPRRMNFLVQGFGVGMAARAQTQAAFRFWRHGDGLTPNHGLFSG